MREIQVQAEWRRSLKAQGAAELLLEADFYEDAVSRAYYTVLHAAKAALLTRDIVTESHKVPWIAAARQAPLICYAIH